MEAVGKCVIDGKAVGKSFSEKFHEEEDGTVTRGRFKFKYFNFSF